MLGQTTNKSMGQEHSIYSIHNLEKFVNYKCKHCSQLLRLGNSKQILCQSFMLGQTTNKSMCQEHSIHSMHNLEKFVNYKCKTLFSIASPWQF